MTESNEIKRDGAKAQKNSGRGHYQKGDAILDGFVTIDYKEYPKGFTVNKDNWSKICVDAQRNGGTIPALKIVLGEGNSKTRLMIISEPFFNEMWELWLKEYGDDE